MTQSQPLGTRRRLLPMSWRAANSVVVKTAFGHTGVTFGGGTLLVFALMALLAPWIAPHDPYAFDVTTKYADPVWMDKGTWEHILGTDEQGRDYLSRIIYGARVSLLIGFGAMLISGVIGTALGVTAGYFGGRADLVVTFIISTRLAMPVVLVALSVVALIGSSILVVIWVLGLLIWDRFAVVMRAATQQVRQMEYVAAAKALGCSSARIVLTEIMPNVANALIVVATLEVAHAVLLEAALSFLGLGVQPPTPSWGFMISEGKGMMFFKPWVIAIPGVFLFLFLLCINMLGDGIGDVFAPENRN